MARAPDEVDPEQGIWMGRRIARRYVSPDGMTVLVGRTAEENDLVTFELGAPIDFWMHVASDSGAHVIVRNPDNLDRLPRETLAFAAALAVRHSRAKGGGTVPVHVCRCSDVRKPRGLPPGKVTISRYTTVKATASET